MASTYIHIPTQHVQVENVMLGYSKFVPHGLYILNKGPSRPLDWSSKVYSKCLSQTFHIFEHKSSKSCGITNTSEIQWLYGWQNDEKCTTFDKFPIIIIYLFKLPHCGNNINKFKYSFGTYSMNAVGR